jgi:hypothetical protein
VLDTSGMPSHTAKAMTKAIDDLRKRFPSASIFEDYISAVEYLEQKLISQQSAADVLGSVEPGKG